MCEFKVGDVVKLPGGINLVVLHSEDERGHIGLVHALSNQRFYYPAVALEHVKPVEEPKVITARHKLKAFTDQYPARAFTDNC